MRFNYVVVRKIGKEFEHADNYPCTEKLVWLTEPRIMRIKDAILICKVYENHKCIVLKGDY